ncbi:hypothetical protein MEX01_41390 [Methylorubrum extorquens]|uniref:hypothetical protein n=1 Tax=Methylorubrum extorquens TaxID=408 RepID=UPI001166ECF2|nr:hypothetical protein [Methylorubrum extorquens]GEL43548.1 hypothetical protein MEX01_41390 [Methylorubrum extorquens]
MLGFEPGPTVIEQLVAEIGTQAMRPLYERIAHPGQPVRKVTLSGRAMLGGETAYCSDKALSRLSKPARRPSDRR